MEDWHYETEEMMHTIILFVVVICIIIWIPTLTTLISIALFGLLLWFINVKSCKQANMFVLESLAKSRSRS